VQNGSVGATLAYRGVNANCASNGVQRRPALYLRVPVVPIKLTFQIALKAFSCFLVPLFGAPLIPAKIHAEKCRVYLDRVLVAVLHASIVAHSRTCATQLKHLEGHTKRS
jgi:hypothetical protein